MLYIMSYPISIPVYDVVVLLQVFQVPSDCAGIISPRCSLEPNHSDGIQSLCLNGTSLFSGGRDMSILKWDLTDASPLKQVVCHRRRHGWSFT